MLKLQVAKNWGFYNDDEFKNNYYSIDAIFRAFEKYRMNPCPFCGAEKALSMRSWRAYPGNKDVWAIYNCYKCHKTFTVEGIDDGVWETDSGFKVAMGS